MTFRTAALLVAGTALLWACGDDTPAEETPAEAGRNAQGEVLGGTISDDMLPLDRLRSQAPSLREEPASQSGGPAASEAEADSAESDGEAAPAEAAEPVAEAPAED